MAVASPPMPLAAAKRNLGVLYFLVFTALMVAIGGIGATQARGCGARRRRARWARVHTTHAQGGTTAAACSRASWTAPALKFWTAQL